MPDGGRCGPADTAPRSARERGRPAGFTRRVTARECGTTGTRRSRPPSRRPPQPSRRGGRRRPRSASSRRCVVCCRPVAALLRGGFLHDRPGAKGSPSPLPVVWAVGACVRQIAGPTASRSGMKMVGPAVAGPGPPVRHRPLHRSGRPGEDHRQGCRVRHRRPDRRQRVAIVIKLHARIDVLARLTVAESETR